jgi:hypothetical protein
MVRKKFMARPAFDPFHRDSYAPREILPRLPHVRLLLQQMGRELAFGCTSESTNKYLLREKRRKPLALRAILSRKENPA